MRITTMLAGPALLTAVALAPAVASPASATQALAQTTVTSSHTSTDVASAPPSEKRKKEYQRGRKSGFAQGRADCKHKRPMSLRTRTKHMRTGSYREGFMGGYKSGYEQHCAPTK